MASPTADGTWTLQVHETLPSTNDAAGRLPAWHAVRALRQTAGRGRYRRSWVSDEGGIWLSAVLPTPGNPADWSVLPLAAGWALRAAVAGLGVSNLRLRWPNDLMVGRAKLAGILVERFRPDSAVVGVGVNLHNRPERVAPELRDASVRLADLLSTPPSAEEFSALLLARLAEAQACLAAGRIADFLPELNAAWRIRSVRLSLSSGLELRGEFQGVDAQGRLLLCDATGALHSLSPLDVGLLRECFPEDESGL